MQTPDLIVVSRKKRNNRKKMDYTEYWKIIWRAITPNERIRTQKK